MTQEIATLAGGCFWCVEAVFDDVIGVESVESGYIGGTVANPTYKQVCGGDTGHAEAIRIGYDPEQLNYGDLLDMFLARGIERLSLVGGLADAIAPWLTPDLRDRLKPPDADGVAGALLVARRRFGAGEPPPERAAASGSRVSNL